MPPAPIIMRAPFGSYPEAFTSGVAASTNATARPPQPPYADENGQFRLSSELGVSGAGDVEWAHAGNVAFCRVLFESNGRAPLEIQVRFRPAMIHYGGSVTNEPGYSEMELRWEVTPRCEIGASLLRPEPPRRLYSFRRTTPEDQSWGPIVHPRGTDPTFEATWVYRSPEVRAGTCLLLSVGIETSHRASGNDVSLSSNLSVDFTLERIRVRAS